MKSIAGVLRDDKRKAQPQSKQRNPVVAAVYAFGLLGVDIPPELITVLVLLAPIVLVLLRRAPGQRGLFTLLVLVLAAGLLELTLDTRGRMLAAGIGVGGCLLIAALTLLYFAFTSPHVIARWTDGNCLLILARFRSPALLVEIGR